MQSPKIYVIVVTWNGMKWIDRCLSCLRQSTIPVKTIVVDNGSTDSTIDYIQKNYPEVELHTMDHNLGFGQANNFGIKIALENHCDFVYLLNQDAYVYPDMFEELLKAYWGAIDNLNIGILSPLHLYRDGEHFDSQFKSYLYNIAPNMTEDALLSQIKPYYEVEGVPAAGWLLPRNTLDNIGGFDPIFFHYGEDHNYFQRAKYHGLKTIVVPSAKMIHDRDGFGNVNMARMDMYFRTVKTELILNITLKIGTIISELIKSEVKYDIESFKYLFRCNFHMFWELQKAVKLNLFYIIRYKADRAQNRKVGRNWL